MAGLNCGYTLDLPRRLLKFLMLTYNYRPIELETLSLQAQTLKKTKQNKNPYKNFPGTYTSRNMEYMYFSLFLLLIANKSLRYYM